MPTTKKVKFMQLLDEKPYRELKREAKKRGIGLQEQLRAIVIPEWLAHQKAKK
jgi:hypothetical protein